MNDIQIDNDSVFAHMFTTNDSFTDDVIVESVVGDSGDDDVMAGSVTRNACVGVALSVVIVATIGGNLLVCVTVARTKQLHTITNYLVVSLAAADLLLALLVLPFSTLTTITGGVWTLGSRLCNIYVSADVTLCTVSILTLFVISLERHTAVTSPYRYVRVANTRTVCRVIAVIWVTSTALGFVPIHLGWNTSDSRVQNTRFDDDLVPRQYCLFAVNRTYVVVVAVTTYFTPLIIMCCVYVRILNITKQQVNQPSRYKHHSIHNHHSVVSLQLTNCHCN